MREIRPLPRSNEQGSKAQRALLSVGPWLFMPTLLVAGVIVLLAPLLRSVVGLLDYPTHIALAQRMNQTGHPPTPHFLYQLFIIIAHVFLRDAGFEVSAFVVSLLSYILLGLIVYGGLYCMVGLPWSFARSALYAGLALSIMLAAPITILTWSQKVFYLGYIGINTYHNPTITLLKPFGFLLFIIAIQAFRRTIHHHSIIVAIAALLSVISTLAKPSLAICLVPALVLMAVYRVIKKDLVEWLLLLGGLLSQSA